MTVKLASVPVVPVCGGYAMRFLFSLGGEKKEKCASVGFPGNQE